MSADGRAPLDVGGEFWLGDGQSARFTRQRVALLAALEQSGSITRAARAVGLSYKAAWEAVDALNNLAETPLVARSAGGKGGGGTRLTPAGLRLVASFETMQAEHERFLARLSEAFDKGAQDLPLLRRMSLRTSARNALHGVIVQRRSGVVNDEIVLRLAGGQQLSATVTRTSADDLGMVPGNEAFALIKASAVIVFAGEPPALASPNVFVGEVTRVELGAVNAELTLTVADHLTLTATLSRTALDDPGYALGARVGAVFSPSAVILAAV